jgi:hypothetical protein
MRFSYPYNPATVRSLRAAFAACALVLPPLSAPRASEYAEPTEYQVKAAFLYNFAKFVEWPEGRARAPFVIGVLGEDPFGEVLDRTISGKTIQSREFAVRRLADTAEAPRVDILFISASEKARLPEVLGRLRGSSVLTVGDTDNFVSRGGMVGFRTKGNVVRFDINLREATRAGLKISSQLLRLAGHVVPVDRPR